MRLLQTIEQYRCESELEARDLIESAREDAATKGYLLVKAEYIYKKKTAKGDIIDEAWVTKLTKQFGTVFE